MSTLAIYSVEASPKWPSAPLFDPRKPVFLAIMAMEGLRAWYWRRSSANARSPMAVGKRKSQQVDMARIDYATRKNLRESATPPHLRAMYGDRKKVEQDKTEYCTDDSEIYTESIGPCIAICIAWRHWATMIHFSEMTESEEDVAEMISNAKEAIPEDLVSTLRPFVCGGDTVDIFGVDDHPEVNEKRILLGRERALAVLHEAGFSEPHVRWNEPGETSALYANLDGGVVSVAVGETDVESWPIVQ